MSHICSQRHVWTFDNFFRPLFHNPARLYSAYVREGMTVVDIGCGAGFTTMGLARLVGEKGSVHAIDVQPEMLEMVRERAEKAGLIDRISFKQCSSGSLGLTVSADFVNAFWMVHEVPDKKVFFTEIHQHLHNEGNLFVAEPVFHVKNNLI